MKKMLTTSKMLMFLGMFVSQKNITREKGTIRAPMNMAPGMALVLENCSIITRSPANTTRNMRKILAKSQGWGQSAVMFSGAGVVFFVPLMKSSSRSSTVWRLNTSLTSSRRRMSVFPSWPVISLMASTNFPTPLLDMDMNSSFVNPPPAWPVFC